jgi:hypothetical protein
VRRAVSGSFFPLPARFVQHKFSAPRPPTGASLRFNNHPLTRFTSLTRAQGREEKTLLLSVNLSVKVVKNKKIWRATTNSALVLQCFLLFNECSESGLQTVSILG